MQNREKGIYKDITFTNDNPENIRKVIGCYKNVLICGIKGVGKITNTMTAVKDKGNVYYIGNPVDHAGKTRPVSYEKYLEYILSLKKDIKIIDDIGPFLERKDDIVIIIDEIFERNNLELQQIGRLMDMGNVRIVQIVGCIKNMGSLIDKIDLIIELHHEGAFTVDKGLGQAICKIFGKKQ